MPNFSVGKSVYHCVVTNANFSKLNSENPIKGFMDYVIDVLRKYKNM